MTIKYGSKFDQKRVYLVITDIILPIDDPCVSAPDGKISAFYTKGIHVLLESFFFTDEKGLLEGKLVHIVSYYSVTV